jgi:hypothetical protein
MRRFERMTSLKCGADDLTLTQTAEPVGTADRTGDGIE